MEGIFIYSRATLTFVLCGIFTKIKKNALLYLIFFCLSAATTMAHTSYADEDEFQDIVEDQGPVYFEYASEKPVLTRQDLILKMTFHKKEHDTALECSKEIIQKLGFWNDDLSELYLAAEQDVCTCICGNRNFLLPAALAICTYVQENEWNNLEIWKDFNTECTKLKYNAERFDFYMKLLHKHFKE